jgi:hypothetical protein
MVAIGAPLALSKRVRFGIEHSALLLALVEEVRRCGRER